MTGPQSSSKKPQQWDSKIRAYVQRQQEREYRRLSNALDLGSDPAKAYTRLSGHSMPFGYASPQERKKELGVESYLTTHEWAQLEMGVAELYKKYFSLELPTPYEDPNLYPSLSMTFDSLQEDLFRTGKSTKKSSVLLATLPSGDINAKIVLAPRSHIPIVFFEHGLFQFFYDFVLLVGWAIPPLSPQQLVDDRLLAQLPRRYTMPFNASGFFFASLYAYVVSGTPIAKPSQIPKPQHNLFAVMMLLQQMERFVMAHELAHIELGHLDSLDMANEYDADAASLAIVSELARENIGSWAFGFWACDLALTAFNFLYRGIGLLAFGDHKLTWISTTHPDPLSRRKRLRDKVVNLVPNVSEVELAAARNLCGMTDTILQRLWEISAPLLKTSYKKGDRPSPMWDSQIEHSITVKN